MEEILPSLEPCLICSKLKTLPISSAAQVTFPTDTTALLNSNLWAVFLLRELLQLPREKCERILLSSGGNHPSDWFHVCPQCSELVRDAIEIHQRILELEKLLGRRREQVSSKMKASFMLQGDDKSGGNAAGSPFSARKYIREFYEDLITPVEAGGIGNNTKGSSESEGAPTFDADNARKLATDDADWAAPDLASDREEDDASSSCDEKYEPSYSPKVASSSCGRVVEDQIKLDAEKRKLELGKRKSSDEDEPRVRGKYRKRLKYKCSSCPATFLKRRICKLHTLMRHTFPNIAESGKSKVDSDESLETGKHRCVVCKTSHCDVAKLTKHLKDHLEYAETSCHICKLIFKSKERLGIHFNAHHKFAVGTSDQGPLIPKETVDNDLRNNEDDEDSNPKSTSKDDPSFNPEEDISSESSRDNDSSDQEQETKTKSKRKTRYSAQKGKKIDGLYHFKCDKCEYECNKPGSKYKHIQSHKFIDNITELSPTEFQCNLCKELHKTKASVKVHLRVKHCSELNLSAAQSCPECGSLFHDLASLRDHVDKVHYKNFRHQCDICGHGFMRPSELEKHKVIHTEEGSQGVQCNICERYFKNAFSLASHKSSCHKEGGDLNSAAVSYGPGMKFCKHCQTPVNNFKAHLRMEHSDLYQYTCELCGEKYQKQGPLIAHKEAEHSSEGTRPKRKNMSWKKRGKVRDYYTELEGKNFLCNLCDTSFPHRRAVSKHLIASHASEMKNVKLSQCPICGNLYVDGFQMKEHMKSVHEKVPMFNCDECGKGFMRIGLFNEHKEKHRSGIEMKLKAKLVECNICDKKFVNLKSMQRHQNKFHRNLEEKRRYPRKESWSEMAVEEEEECKVEIDQ